MPHPEYTSHSERNPDPASESLVADSLEPNGVVSPPTDLPLEARHYAELKASGISDEVIRQRGYRTVTTSGTLIQAEFTPQQSLYTPGFLVPIRNLAGIPVLHQYKADNPRVIPGKRGKPGKPAKYDTPKGKKVVLDIPLGIGDKLGDATITLIVTEGSKKVDSGVTQDLCVIGVLGVDSFQSEGVTWDGIVLQGRIVLIAYDSDATTKDEVRGAQQRLGQFLSDRGAHVYIVEFMPFSDGSKQGLDDFLVRGGTLSQLLQLSEPFTPQHATLAQRRVRRGPVESIVTRGDEVPLKRVRWLWYPYFALGKATVVIGDMGLGKSTAALDIAARVTKGWKMPGDAPNGLGGPANVLVLSTEDAPKDTIMPRFIAAGGDTTRIYFQKIRTDEDGVLQLTIPDDLDVIEETVRRYEIKLIVLDPLSAYLGEKTDSHREKDVRRALAPLAELAEEYNLVVIGIRHMNKNAQVSTPEYRGIGSVAFEAQSRNVLFCAKYEGPRLPGLLDPAVPLFALAGGKNNLGPTAPTLLYHIQVNPEVGRETLPDGTTEPVDASFIVWLENVGMTIRELLGDGKDNDKARELLEFMKVQLANGPVRTPVLMKACKDAGLSWSTLSATRYKEKIGVHCFRCCDGLDCKYWWGWQARVHTGDDGVITFVPDSCELVRDLSSE